MVNMQTLSDLFRHMEWADSRVWDSVLASEQGRADEKLRGYLYHLHMVQFAFLRTWRGEPRDTPYPTFDSAEPLMAWARAYYEALFPHLETIRDDGLSAALPLPWAAMVEKRFGRKPATTTVGDTGLQVALHSMYHRGQVNARLRQVGGEPPLVDYIAWIWLDRPAADWPSAR